MGSEMCIRDRRLIGDSEKRRWEIQFENGKFLIRAVQGHSIKSINDEELLQRINPVEDALPAVCVCTVLI